MKALSYLKVDVQCPPDFWTMHYPNWIVKEIMLNHIEHMFFHNQKFEPEMIMKYFKGWEFNTDERYYYIGEHQTAIYVDEDNNYLYSESYIGDNAGIIFTLDDFIIYCTNAGINLEWKDL